MDDRLAQGTLVRADRRFAVADVGGVQIDLSEQPLRAGRALARVPVGTVSVPVDAPGR